MDVTDSGGLVARDALITQLTTADVKPFDPVIARMMADDSSIEREPGGHINPFPVFFTAVTDEERPGGTGQNLVLMPGQVFRDGDGETVMRRFNFTELEIQYASADNVDFNKPSIFQTRGDFNGVGDVEFDVIARDDEGLPLQRVLVLFKDVAGRDWRPIDLTRASTDASGKETWTGSAPATDISGGELEFFVQVLDAPGNLGFSANKGSFFRAFPVGGYLLDPSCTGWCTSPVTVDLAEGVVDATITINGNDGSLPTTFTDEGIYVVTATADGTTSTAEIKIDNSGPVISGPSLNPSYPLNADVTINYSCADSGIGTASCLATVDGEPVSSEGLLPTATVGSFTLIIEAIDKLGNTSTANYDYVVLPGRFVVGTGGDVDRQWNADAQSRRIVHVSAESRLLRNRLIHL
jgi:hypothetical protein